ncbi:MAG: RluA family pseudouridine synthase [Clostridia bacterium]|nr:RluA family pseudouridine synthase [Clostridia bacterium]
MEKKIITVDVSGERLDVYLAKALDFSRSKIQKLIDGGNVLVNGNTPKSKEIVKEGSVIEVEIPEPVGLEVKAVDIPIDVIYEDSDVAVINKPQGLTVHQGSGTGDETLVNALLYHLDSLSGINGVIRPGIVHRIDKDTSGLLVVAKNDQAHLSLSSQIEKKTCRREYVALLEGNLKQDSGRIETYISRSTKNRTMMAVSSSGRKAVTNFEVLERAGGYTLCKFLLETGRTHQIRVHSKHLGHPIVGDTVYGYKNQKFNLLGQLLHARKLSFTHPSTKEFVEFTAPIPEYFSSLLEKLGFKLTK